MLCFSNLKKSLLYSLLFSFLVLSFSLVVNVADSFALEDVSFDLTSSATTICTNWTSSYDSLCGYSYMIIESTNNRGTAVSCSGTLPGNVHSYSVSSSYASFAIVTPNFSSGYTYDSFTCRASNSLATIHLTLTNSYLPSAPSGNIDITENGTYDVTNYASATVNIENEIIYGDYHNDLININNSILICGAICLVLYFFYSIYRMIIKSTGGS